MPTPKISANSERPSAEKVVVIREGARAKNTRGYIRDYAQQRRHNLAKAPPAAKDKKNSPGPKFRQARRCKTCTTQPHGSNKDTGQRPPGPEPIYPALLRQTRTKRSRSKSPSFRRFYKDFCIIPPIIFVSLSISAKHTEGPTGLPARPPPPPENLAQHF